MIAAPRPHLLSLLLCAFAHAAVIPTSHAAPGEKFAALTADELSGIASALPAKARATPLKPRRLLVFYRTQGYVHQSIPVANETLKRLGESTGAYAVEITDEMSAFDPARLSKFDGVIFVNTTGLTFDDPVHRKALLDFVSGGKGLIGLHAASDNFPTWPEGQALMGGVFHGHPWGAGDTVAIKLDDPSHEVNRAFAGNGFWLKEEIYQMREPYSREKLRILSSLDMSRQENTRPADKIKRTDNDFGISWIKSEGAGRVFYTSLGHNKDIFFVPSILQHLLDGIQFALGDLKADTIPSARLSRQPAPAPAPDDKVTLQTKAARSRLAATPIPDETLARLARVEPLRASPDLGQVESILRSQNPAQRAQFEPRLIKLLTDQETTATARQAVIDLLAWSGSARSVSALERCTADDALADRAVRALAQLDGDDAESALLRLAANGTENVRVSALNALGQRSAQRSIPVLKKTAVETTPAIAQAALAALVAHGSPDALDAIASLPHNETTLRALLDTGATLLRSNTPSAPTLRKVGQIAEDALTAAKSTTLRIEACRLLLLARKEQAVRLLQPRLRDNDADLRQYIAHAFALSDYPSALKVLQDEFAILQPDVRAVILAAALDTGRTALRPLALPSLTADDSKLQMLAILAAGSTGDASTVDTLLPLLDNTGEVGKAARTSIGYLPKGEADSVLRARLSASGSDDQRIRLVKILADRQDRETFRQAIAFTSSDEKKLRAAGFECVLKLSRPGDLPVVLPLAPRIKSPDDRRDWQKVIFTTAGNHPAPAEAVKMLETAIIASDSETRPALIIALTAINTPEATKSLHALLSLPDVERRKEVIRALASARNTSAYALLGDIAKTASQSTERILALRGYVETVDSIGLNHDNQVKAYRSAWGLAERTEEKEMILSAVKRIGNQNNKEVKKFIEEFDVPAKAPAATA